MYPTWLSKGIHVVTANKRAGSGSIELYEACRRAATTRSQWYYETTGPGSGLPVLSTLRDIIQSGDRVKSVEGCFSGTFAYLMDEARKGTPLSAALRSASKLGYLEPDPRNDLTGSDVRRKTVIVIRDA